MNGQETIDGPQLVIEMMVWEVRGVVLATWSSLSFDVPPTFQPHGHLRWRVIVDTKGRFSIVDGRIQWRLRSPRLTEPRSATPDSWTSEGLFSERSWTFKSRAEGQARRGQQTCTLLLAKQSALLIY